MGMALVPKSVVKETNLIRLRYKAVQVINFTERVVLMANMSNKTDTLVMKLGVALLACAYQCV